jgi:hypothetical protein
VTYQPFPLTGPANHSPLGQDAGGLGAQLPYKNWGEQTGERIVSKRKFCAALGEKGFEGYTKNTLWFRGVEVADSTE